MSDIIIETLTVAASGTTSTSVHRAGYSLVGLIIPALDSTTIEFEASQDNSTFTSVFTNSGTPAAATLGTAATGAKIVAVPEEIGRLAAVMHVRLKVASQTGGARTFKALLQRR